MMFKTKLFVAVQAIAAMVGVAIAAPTTSSSAPAPTLYLAGDSTMAENGGGGVGAVGFGHYLPYSLSIPVVNKAIGGRSARSYTVQGRFQQIASVLKPNDIVLIEFGHNDPGNYSDPNGRPDCPGNGDQTCWDPTSNTTVYTFHKYLVWAGRNFTTLGATVVVASRTPDNPYEFGTFNYTPSEYVRYARDAARAIGKGAVFVDHGGYVADRERELGNATYVSSLYPIDHTHTNGDGADLTAKALVKGLLCGRERTELKRFVVNATRDVPGRCRQDWLY